MKQNKGQRPLRLTKRPATHSLAEWPPLVRRVPWKQEYSRPDFYAQASVINGASELFGEVFGSAHARSAVGVAALPLNVSVEVEAEFALVED